MIKILDKIIASEAIGGHVFQKKCATLSIDNPLPQFRPDTKRRKLDEFLQDHDATVDLVRCQDQDNLEALEQIDFTLDPFYRSTLKSHQLEGLRFMWDRVYRKKRGCLLSHSMGLGKTAQVIALLTTLYRQLKAYPSTEFPTGKRVMVLAPVVTISNWAEEFTKWALDDFEEVLGEVYNFSSIRDSGNRARQSQTRIVDHWYTHGGVMLVGYEQFRLLTQKRDSVFFEYFVQPGPDIVIFDEGHRIKNAASALSHQISLIDTPSRICLTGYPLQNHLSEYHYMISSIEPSLLGTPARFRQYFSHVIEQCFHDSTKIRKKEAAIKLYVLQLLVNDIMQRRDESILTRELPVKTEYLITFKLSPIQLEGYMFLLKHVVNGMNPLLALLVLRAVCNHPKIFENLINKRLEKKRQSLLNKELKEKMGRDEEKEEEEEEGVGEEAPLKEEEEELLQMLDFDSDKSHQLVTYFKTLDTESWSCAGKMSFIANLAVESKAQNDKLVIVSHSLACLDYIQHFLPVLGINMLRIDGGTAGNLRSGIIHSFTKDKEIHVMLLSAKAAGIGINLTSANRIILVDQDWNPLYDEQSIGRIYRFGQTKPVYVYRLVTASTIEESIKNQSIHKNSIFRRVIDNDRHAVHLAKDDLKQYFKPPQTDMPTLTEWDSHHPVFRDPTSSALYRNDYLVQADLYSVQAEEGTRGAYILTEKDKQNAKREAIDYRRRGVANK